jgi:hypothetical protein
MEEWPHRDQLAEPKRDSSPILKPRTRAQQQYPLDLRIKDPVAVGVHVALKETPLLFELFPAHLSLSTFLQKA